MRSSVALIAVLLIVLGCFCFRTTSEEDPTFGTWAMSNQAKRRHYRDKTQIFRGCSFQGDSQ